MIERLCVDATGDAVWARRERLAQLAAPPAERVVIEVEAAAFAGPELARAGAVGTPDRGVAVVGRVAEAGPGAAHLVGARVVAPSAIPCGDCGRCRRGYPERCPERDFVGADGGVAIASHVAAASRWLCPLTSPIEVLGPQAALLPREAAMAYSMYARANVAPGARAVVVGRSVVARLCLEILAAQGVAAIAVADDDAWAELARGLGADVLRGLADRADPAELWAELRARAPESAGGELPEAVFETSGTAEGRRLALELAQPGATVMLAGRGISGATLGEPVAVDRAADEGVRIVGIAGPHPDLIPEVAALAARGELDLAGAAIPTPLDELAERVSELQAGRMPGRAPVLTWTATR